jgi:hypothetical protein
MENEMKVGKLSSYGKVFDHLPLKAQLLQAKIMFSELNKKFGLFGAIGFLLKVSKRRKQLKTDHGITISENFPGISSSAKNEIFMMGALYYTLSDIDGKEKAYEFIQVVVRKLGPTLHSILYDINNLKKCEGDIYANFCKLNRSLFENSAATGFYELEIEDSENLQYIHMTKCLNVDVFTRLGCPEMGRMGCDFDIGGYAPEALGDKVNLDFRRPNTLANGDKSCDFYYYRKGHAPKDMRTM